MQQAVHMNEPDLVRKAHVKKILAQRGPSTHESQIDALRNPFQFNQSVNRSSVDLHFIACGLIGEPVPPVMISGGPQKKNS
jgi:hypothetical protein